MKKYKSILADPPWPYKIEGPRAAPAHRPNSWDGVTGSVSSALRYGSMSMNELKNLAVEKYADDNAHLYLWTTNAFMVEAHELAEAWGFDPKTIITWVKIRQDDGKPSMKTGYYYRGATEHILFAVRGSLRLQGNPHPTAILHERLPHSRKPGYVQSMIEKQSPGPHLEIFARPLSPLFPKREEWDVWGDEIGFDVDLL